jgi:hypothetical protein
MLDHLETTPGALPLLQFAAAKLWESRDKARKLLTHQAYAGMGGVAGALASHADRVIEGLGQQKAGLARSLLLRLVTPERTRAIVPMAELRELSREVGEVQNLVDQMVDARLLVVQTLEGGKGSTVEIVHESLVQGWPMLRRWLDENQDDAALVDQLRLASRQWAQKNRDAGMLWRGDTADEAKKFRKRYKGPLSDVERGFLDAVVAHEQAAIRRKRAGVIFGFIFLSALVVGAMVVAVYFQRLHGQAQKAEKSATEAQGVAEQRLAETQAKEKERQIADAERIKALEAKSVVDVKLNKSEENLVETNKQLAIALEEAQKDRDDARGAKTRAEQGEQRAEKAQAEAEVAKEDAIKAKKEAERLYKAEAERAARMEKQLGTKIVPTLK